MRCPYCSTDLPEYAEFCPSCNANMTGNRQFHAALEIAAVKEAVATLHARLNSSIQILEQRLQEDIPALEEKLSVLEAKLIDTEKPSLDATASRGISENVSAQLEESTFMRAGEKALGSRPVTATSKSGKRLSFLSKKTPNTGSSQGAMEIQLGQKWLLIIGVAITVLGVGYFLKYSFDQQWIGPAEQVALAYLSGIVCLGVGEVFRRREMYRGFGFALLGGGIAVLYFSGFAAFQIYGLISQSVAFGLLVLVTLLAGMMAYVYDAQWLAILGLAGGFATPVALSTGTDNQVVLMTYMSVLNLCMLALARVRTWRLPSILAFIFTWAIFAGWFYRYYDEDRFWLTLLFLNIFYVIHFLAPVGFHLQREDKISVFGFGTALANAFVAFGFSHYMISEFATTAHVGIVSLAYACMAALLAAWLHRRQIPDQRPFVMLLIQAALFLVITIPIVFSQHWITVFWAIQAVVLAWGAVRLANGKLAIGALLLLAAAVGKLYCYDYEAIFRFNQRFMYSRGFTTLALERWLTVAASLGAVAVTAGLIGTLSKKWGKIVWGFFLAFLFISLSLEVSAYFGETAPKARFAALSVLWGLYAVVLLFMGFARNSSLLRKTGMALFGVTILKVFLVDMANVSTPFRIVSFVVLGVLLIGASFLYYYHKDKLIPGSGTSPVSPLEEKRP